jgi:hypothetical protein
MENRIDFGCCLNLSIFIAAVFVVFVNVFLNFLKQNSASKLNLLQEIQMFSKTLAFLIMMFLFLKVNQESQIQIQIEHDVCNKN